MQMQYYGRDEKFRANLRFSKLDNRRTKKVR